ncbi:MAG: hypothetical protein AAF787_03245, partial [Chloroflexota bacterium]
QDLESNRLVGAQDNLNQPSTPPLNPLNQLPPIPPIGSDRLQARHLPSDCQQHPNPPIAV